MYWLPLKSERRVKWSLPRPENESQQNVDDFLSCILGSLSGDWMQTFINEIKAAFRSRRESDTLSAPF
jgi:hypothetical protein